MKQLKKKIKNVRKQLQKHSQVAIVKIFKSVIKPLSRFSVRVFEHKNIRAVLSVFVAVSFTSVAILPNSISIAQTTVYKNLSQIQPEEEVAITEKSLRLPVDSFTVTQGFNFFHTGIDLAAVKGSPVYPVMDGTVVYVGYGRFGYGNQVIVNHGSGFKSLYAHFAKIEAKTGEKITKDSILGLVGSTGWSTGPHLHLQIWEQDKWTNPRAFFESYFGRKLASTK